jgi:hypothetical protein
MKAQELRIGNYIDGSGLMEVTAINKNKVNIYDHYNKSLLRYALPVERFKGFPLTEEWLLKFGFTKHPISWLKDISYFPKNEFKALCVTLSQGIIIRCGELCSSREQDEVMVLWNTDIKGHIMVHQLQNLYFALTGEELTIKP